MPAITLSSDQLDALDRMRSGCILKGDTGSGKSLTGVAFYYKYCGGEVNTGKFVPMKTPLDLYIITTARKRDLLEWEKELGYFLLSTDPSLCYYKIKVVVDSWQNIDKYADTENSFFIFDEQRLVGYGAWAHAFLKIAAHNKWIMLTATPGDRWEDYMTVFIANGFYKHKTDFIRQHVVYTHFTKWPQVSGYMNEGRLIKLRNLITVELGYDKHTIQHHEDVFCDFDSMTYEFVTKNRWNVFKEQPITNASEYCAVLRQIVNSSPDRQWKLLDIVKEKKKVIIFYNYDYELEILRNLFKDHYPMTEWNGHKHQPLLDTDHWVYLVQYTAGAEAWNCITTDTIVFFSQAYSYKQMKQAAGRIDRRNTPYVDLFYYHMKSKSKIDSAISKTLKRKKKFSEKGFAPFFDEASSKTPTHRQLDIFETSGVDAGKTLGDEVQTISSGKKYPCKIEDYVDIYNSWEDPNPPQGFYDSIGRVTR